MGLTVLGDVLPFPEHQSSEPYELVESRYISTLDGMDKVQIVVCHCGPCEFCRVCGHIHSIARSGMAKGMVILNKVPVSLLPSR
jgi:hypothetical protein